MRLMGAVCLVLAMFLVYSGPVTAWGRGIQSKSYREYMSVPCTQLARAYVLGSKRLSEDEIKLIREYVPACDEYFNNQQGIADMFKKNLDNTRFVENKEEFIRLWFGVGLKCPAAYLDAWARLSIGLWYPDMNYRDPAAYHPYWEYVSTEPREGYETVGRETPASMKWLADFYNKLTYENGYQRIPVLSMLFSSGILIWIVLLYMGFFIYQRKVSLLCPAFCILGLWLTLLLGPVVLYRYIYPIVVSIPIFLCTLFSSGVQTDCS